MSARALVSAALLLAVIPSVAGASVKEDLESAARLEKVAFILVTDSGTAGVDQAKQTIERARSSLGRTAVFVLDRSESENAGLVSKYGLLGAPVPLILVMARNGALAGGLIAESATPEKLVALVPSPKKAAVLKHLEEGKAVFIYASRKGMVSGAGAASCAAACAKLDGKCVTVDVDMDDPKETDFLKSLKVNLASVEPTTLVVNLQGQLTGAYTGAPDITNLVQAATKKAGGCCPSTVQSGSKSCPPAK